MASERLARRRSPLGFAAWAVALSAALLVGCSDDDGGGAGNDGAAGAGGGGGAGMDAAAAGSGGGGSAGADAGNAPRDAGGGGAGGGGTPLPDAGPVTFGPIIDTHTHFWDPEKPGGIKFPTSPSPLYRKVLPPEYDMLARPLGITGTVLVESGWSMEDNMWALDLADKNPIIVAVIAGLDPKSAMFRTQLDTLAANKYFRGFRTGRSDLSNAALRDNWLAAAEKGLVVEVNTSDSGAPAVMNLVTQAKAFPTLTLVLDHAGYLPFAGAPTAAWVAALNQAKDVPNLFCKVSRFQEQQSAVGPALADVESYRKALDVLWEAFGEDRLIFGSNWPLSTEKGTLADAVKIMKDYFASKGQQAADKFFSGNAKKVYKYAER